MAGGAGKRLWPMSRKDRPKQLLRLVGKMSLLEISVSRLEGLFDPEQIFIITNAEYADLVSQQLTSLPRENVIGEPEGRDTSNAIALMAEILAGKDEDGTMAVFTADHVIRPEEDFRNTVKKAMEGAEANPGALITFGIRPTWAHTGLGYVRRGEQVSPGLLRVRSFHEKPDHQTAVDFLDSGEYYWNSGMFVWTLPAIRSAVRTFMPDSATKLSPVCEAVRSGADYMAVVNEVYSSLEKVSIDYAVMEKAEDVMMVELGCNWIDVGSWCSLPNVLDTDGADNVLAAENVKILDSRNNVLVSSDENHLLTVVGLSGCIVVHTPDVTLVCSKSDDQLLKQVVDSVADDFGGKFV
jgi:mannose-1-phosphate guanylyltransferase